MKKLKAMFLIILMLFPSLVIFYPNNANAKTIADLRRELDEIEQREKENNNNIYLTETEIKTTQNEVGNIYAEIEEITKNIKESEEEVEDIIERYAGVAEVVCDECMRVSGFLNQNERVVTKL